MRFAMSSSPHIRCSDNTRRIMLDVLIALLPTLLAGTIFFGLRCLLLAAVSIAAAGLAEALWNKLTRRYQTVEDLTTSTIWLSLSTLHGPAITEKCPPPIVCPATSTAVSAGWNFRLAFL